MRRDIANDGDDKSWHSPLEESGRDIVSQDALVYDLADFLLQLSDSKIETKKCCSPGAILNSPECR